MSVGFFNENKGKRKMILIGEIKIDLVSTIDKFRGLF